MKDPEMKSPSRKVWHFGIPAAAMIALAVFVAFFSPDADPPNENSGDGGSGPVVRMAGGYTGSDACRECHPQNHATWHASYHRTMTQVPTPENVVADFDGTRLIDHDRFIVLSEEDGRFFADMDDPDWDPALGLPPRIRREIVLMTGSHHEQDFWFETPYGREVSRLPFVYRIEEQTWYPDTSVLLTPPDSPSGFGNWNLICIQCHTTLGRPRIQKGTGYAMPEVVELGISCEACHGPGEAHVRRYQMDPSGNDSALAKLDQIVDPGKLDHRRSSETCGQCHSITLFEEDDLKQWAQHGFQFRPGKKLADHRIVVEEGVTDEDAILQQRLKDDPHFLQDRFWADGMIRVVGREFSGLVRSPCYQKGTLSCLSCHDMHPDADDGRPLKEWANDQLRKGLESNQACLQCHEEFGQDISSHTHHAADSEGSHCYNCHMPHTTYGLLKAVRSHQIDSPSLASSLTAGRPNACNLCHLDKSMGWADDHLVEWYGHKPSQLTEDQSTIPASILWSLQGDAGQRALMAWAMGWPPAQQPSGTDWQGRILAELLSDSYDVVPLIAARSLRTLPGFGDFQPDPITPPEAREENRSRAQEIWLKWRRSQDHQENLSDLFRSKSESPESILARLLKTRNTRRVELAE